MNTGECEYGHRIRLDQTTRMLLRRTNDNGETLWDQRTGEVALEAVELPVHIVHESAFDPTGLVPALCEHGVLPHPLGLQLRQGRSWVRSRYVNGDSRLGTIGVCIPVCIEGGDKPEDFT